MRSSVPWLCLLASACTPSGPSETPTPPPAVATLEVTFTTLEVIDDKESGSGDWRIALRVDGKPLGEPVLGEANAGGSVAIDRVDVSSGPAATHQVIVTAKVEEWDGGFDNSWEFIGEETVTFGKAESFGVGGQVIELETDEGHVRLHYVIARQ